MVGPNRKLDIVYAAQYAHRVNLLKQDSGEQMLLLLKLNTFI